MRATRLLLLLALLLPCGPTACNSEVNRYIEDLGSANPMVRLEAATRARHVDDKRLAAALAPLLQDSSTEIRLQAAISLSRIGTTEEAPALIGALKDPDREVRLAAVDALGVIPDERAVEPLCELMRSEPEPYSIIWALGSIGSDEALDDLTPMLEHDNRYVRYQASRALLKIH